MSEAKTKKLSKSQVLRAAILKVEPFVIEYANAIVRLRGIVAGSTASETEKKTMHRVQTILGYRKRLLKIGAGLHGVMGELAGVQALAE